MKLFIKLSVFTLLTTATASAFAYFFWNKPKFSKHVAGKTFTTKNIDRNDAIFLRLKQKALSIKDFAKDNSYNDTRCFLVDMRVASGSKRFFVYNFQKDSIEAAGLVTHGSGSDKGADGLSFSNRPNSNATSLGRYRVGKPYQGKFGLAYKLYGLDETNNKAFDRFVVLHSHSCVPNGEVAPLRICESWGCPTVAPAFLAVLKKYIDNSSRPMLLCIYY
jgi:hypothetical protein